MSKAILVIDMPENCKKCDFQANDIRDNPICILCTESCAEQFRTKDEYKRINTNLRTKPDWCPLRPMPEKKQELNFNYILAEAKSREEVTDGVLMSFMIDGYNACIDEIGGGANETDKETHQSP